MSCVQWVERQKQAEKFRLKEKKKGRIKEKVWNIWIVELLSYAQKPQCT